ncbi:nicotinate (nicotinamide) nucleotide adenylyltransferase [Candidatus Gottesmanbacteria bacterium RBG_16_43_7]|uniref:Probable nicotinate-nucleotide adenylyltransferase n=1 Tax=Candidatus Gottesmanbacteria bacterium RBG_16_43_7 TaxID=1798373 RepID=A0A1F5ZAC6_9BACT|nr:MAG: nicotinate (nicotinamide) nucleotide adenylyltransferase [Candidatus Gottesmanbacteria bacterium RBG_16_43_7]
MKIALLGGAFNPPHIGHTMIARQVLDFTDYQQIWFLPNYSQSPPKPVAGVEHRLNMTRFLEFPGAVVSTVEIDNKLDGQTVNTLPHLPKEHTYCFVIGSDQLPVFHLWGRWQELLKSMPFLVFPRYGYPNEPLYENMTVVGHRFLIGSNISSTKIRERVKAGLSIAEFVPAGVGEYITKNSLYKE